MRILLHTCCGPCILHPFRELSEEGEVTAYFYNPNIHPYGEWKRRLETLEGHCRSEGIELVAGEYDVYSYFEALEGDFRERCRRCFALRLDNTAAKARELDCDAFSTTLLVSPYQERELVVLAGERAASKHGVAFLDRDFRGGYRWSVGRSRQLRMYRQNYCGCVFSAYERETQEAKTQGRREKPGE